MAIGIPVLAGMPEKPTATAVGIDTRIDFWEQSWCKISRRHTYLRGWPSEPMAMAVGVTPRVAIWEFLGGLIHS
jgi:hypothetical protein